MNSIGLTRLINDVLGIEGLGNGNWEVQFQECNPALLVREAVPAVDALARETDTELTIHANAAKFTGDPDRLVQALANLIAHAIKNSLPGSDVMVTATADADEVRFDVADQGRGIVPDCIDNAFDRFGQVDTEGSLVSHGACLGLGTSRGIVNELGGEMWAQTTLDIGGHSHSSSPQVAKPTLTPQGEGMGNRILVPFLAARSQPEHSRRISRVLR